MVEHPARLECDTTVALREFPPSYRRAAPVQASHAVLGAVLGVAAWWRSGTPIYLIGALTLGAVVPFTLLAVFPTNARLLSPELDPSSPVADALLQRWGRLHAVRSIAGLCALAFMLLGVASG